jgi:hypothetical protein
VAVRIRADASPPSVMASLASCIFGSLYSSVGAFAILANGLSAWYRCAVRRLRASTLHAAAIVFGVGLGFDAHFSASSLVKPVRTER